MVYKPCVLAPAKLPLLLQPVPLPHALGSSQPVLFQFLCWVMPLSLTSVPQGAFHHLFILLLFILTNKHSIEVVVWYDSVA